MSYYFSTTVDANFDAAVARVTEALKTRGFGVLTKIDVRDTLKQKIDVEFRNYTILGACNPAFAHRALQAEDKIGAMLPCNVVVQETPDGTIEVAVVDPIASMAAVENPNLAGIATEVQGMLKAVLEEL